jgi:hypothetical protein
MALTGAQYMSIRTKFLGLMGSPYQGVSSAELDSFLGQLIGEVTGTVTATQKNNADSMLAGYLTSPAYTATAANIAEFFSAAVAALPVITTALTAPRYLQLKQQFTGVLSYAGIRTAAEMLGYMAGYLLPVDLSVFFTPGTVLQSVQSDLGVTQGATFTWSDQSGNGKHYTQSTAVKQPTLTAGLNGYPGVLFTQDFGTPANSDVLVSSLNLPAPGTTPTWIGMVWRNITPSANGRPFCDNSTGISQTAYMYASDSNLGLFNGGPGPQSNFTLNNWECSEFYFSNSAADYIKRGSNAAVTGAGANNGTGAGRNLGGNDTSVNYATFELLHMIYVNSKQVSAIANWRAAVSTKYGVSVSV